MEENLLPHALAGGPYPYYGPEVFETSMGVPYLKEPGMALLSKPETHLEDTIGLLNFLEGFHPDLGFESYQEDLSYSAEHPSEALVKFAGQLCYLSLGHKRTSSAQVQKYLTNIIDSGHGSVLEHVNYTMLLWGVSRSFTHELVRHRAGFAYSQVSQRYVDGSKLRFVMRPEYEGDEELEKDFRHRIERRKAEYHLLASNLTRKWEQDQSREWFHKMTITEKRKAVNQVAREDLPNCTEAPIVVTANARAWRHFMFMRAAKGAETEIRRVAYRVWKVLSYDQVAPLLFNIGVGEEPLPDGSTGLNVQRV